jgi:hypothetical protein
MCFWGDRVSYRVLKEAEDRAETRMANLMDATIAFIRKKNTTWLGLLATNTEERIKSIITKEAFDVMSFLIRRKNMGLTAMNEVRMIHPDFDPDKHLGVVTRDDDDRITSFEPADLDVPLTKDLLFAASVWKTAIRHGEFVDGIIESIELYADGLWELTGTALVRRMTDFSGRTTYAIDHATADDITAEVWGETQPALPAPEPEEAETK